jgi:hypothetical protein
VKLWRRQRPEPVDRTREWEGLLHSFRTRSSPAMRLEAYHREARERQTMARAVATLTPRRQEFQPPRDYQFSSPPATSSEQPKVERAQAPTSTPSFESPFSDAPGQYDESEAARLQRRYGDGMDGYTTGSWSSSP